MKNTQRILIFILTLLLIASLFGCGNTLSPASHPDDPVSEIDAPVFTLEPNGEQSNHVERSTPSEAASDPIETPCPVSEDGQYWTKDEVALYIHLFGHLPSNYISKTKAQKLGWTGGSLEPYAPGCSIGGGYFGNYEGLLPTKKGRTYTECDIDTRGARSRGAKRIVFSNDGLIYYTDDHYETFTLLYGEE